MQDGLQSFTNQFTFRPNLAWKIGVERERFIVNRRGMPEACASSVLMRLQRSNTQASEYTYELSACQLESRTRPCTLDELGAELGRQERQIIRTTSMMGLSVSHDPVGPEDMPLDIYPDNRYLEITKRMSRDELRKACRIIAVHIHVGMPDADTALRVYNRVRKNLVGLCSMGDKSGGERLRIYRGFTPSFDPPYFPDWESFFRFALEHGCAHDIRRWWSVIRISRHGTIEFRMFDATHRDDEIVKWARTVLSLCKAAT